MVEALSAIYLLDLKKTILQCFSRMICAKKFLKTQTNTRNLKSATIDKWEPIGVKNGDGNPENEVSPNDPSFYMIQKLDPFMSCLRSNFQMHFEPYPHLSVEEVPDSTEEPPCMGPVAR
ncbi:hypothetical protein AVEN_232700-1 [Araneus ventricosus]|uniref:Uncharacterized protein n=1 Tax=Araneus ventricosus TaxID=182803 RepID=A0A4Y2WJG6_ARAVE|nr:hypothetical protein AVEN_232700-1 [Araneus ventricosus]